MSHTDHQRARRQGVEHADRAPKHQPRPIWRRAKTKAGQIRRALKEA
jgi:hypothetical protein